MKKTNNMYLLTNYTAKKLYKSTEEFPIYDYHCHLSTKEIYENKPFENIGEIWLSCDHYKWRLMRAAGVDESYITGNAPWYEKFQKYAEISAFAAGNPLYHWNKMELSLYFNIEIPLNGENAGTIWENTEKIIKSGALSPRKTIKNSNIKYIATTDDIIDSLEYHKLLVDEKSLGSDFDVTVAPTFRTDNLLLINKKEYVNYIKKLSDAVGFRIENLLDLQKAVQKRLDFFVSNGCKFSDVGIPYFPDRVGNFEEADMVFKTALSGRFAENPDYMGFLGYMYVFLVNEYARRNMIMQMHLMVQRNANNDLFEKCGPDSGGDCIGDSVKCEHIVSILNAVQKNGKLPQTIIYTLNPETAAMISTIAGSFRNVRCGAAWWFCDHKRGIRNQMEIIAETGHIGSFLGMLTDSRSFLSYARHDYFRRILCSMLGEWVESGEYPEEEAFSLLKLICYENIKNLIFAD